MTRDEKDICSVCGGTGQVSFFQGVSRFLLTTEECPGCAGTGYQLESENEPKGKSAPEQKSSQVKSEEPVRGNATILAVDDNPAMRNLIVETLEPLGYKILIAASGKEALEISLKKDEKIDLLLADIVMPGMSGRKLIKELQAQRPDMKALLMSGYPADIVGPNSQLEPHLNFISKPFGQVALTQKINQVLEGSSVDAADD
jgi:CheY-like chemotaxis protein